MAILWFGTIVLALTGNNVVRGFISGAELQRLQGEWVLVAIDGFRFVGDMPESKVYVFKDDRFVYPEGAMRRVRLNPISKPQEIDLLGDVVERGGLQHVDVSLGIYRLDGDKLTLTFGGSQTEKPDGKWAVVYSSRPTKFEHEALHSWSMVLKKKHP